MSEEIISDYVPPNIKKEIIFLRLSIFLGIIVSSAYTLLSIIIILRSYSNPVNSVSFGVFYYFVPATIIVTMILIA